MAVFVSLCIAVGCLSRGEQKRRDAAHMREMDVGSYYHVHRT